MLLPISLALDGEYIRSSTFVQSSILFPIPFMYELDLEAPTGPLVSLYAPIVISLLVLGCSLIPFTVFENVHFSWLPVGFLALFIIKWIFSHISLPYHRKRPWFVIAATVFLWLARTIFDWFPSNSNFRWNAKAKFNYLTSLFPSKFGNVRLMAQLMLCGLVVGLLSPSQPKFSLIVLLVFTYFALIWPIGIAESIATGQIEIDNRQTTDFKTVMYVFLLSHTASMPWRSIFEEIPSFFRAKRDS
jgi:hypothetical protein